MTGTGVVVENLRYRYPGSDRAALAGLTLAIGAGERVAVLGPNGSGKTTFVHHLNGLLELQEGRIIVGDLVLDASNLDRIRRLVGLVFQDPDDQLFMQTVADDVAFGPANLGIKGSERQAVVEAALDSAGASALADRTPHHLSGGEKRSVAIATVLAMSPEVLVFDEPTSGLDPVGRRELAELLDTLTQTQIVVTHDLPFALATCERSVIISDGRIAADRSTAELLGDTEFLAQHRLELPFGFTPPSS